MSIHRWMKRSPPFEDMRSMQRPRRWLGCIDSRKLCRVGFWEFTCGVEFFGNLWQKMILRIYAHLAQQKIRSFILCKRINDGKLIPAFLGLMVGIVGYLRDDHKMFQTGSLSHKKIVTRDSHQPAAISTNFLKRKSNLQHQLRSLKCQTGIQSLISNAHIQTNGAMKKNAMNWESRFFFWLGGGKG